jgi:hypothetical protein
MTILDEIRDTALMSRYERAEADARRTASNSKSTKECLSDKSPQKRIRQIEVGDLVKLRRLG